MARTTKTITGASTGASNNSLTTHRPASNTGSGNTSQHQHSAPTEDYTATETVSVNDSESGSSDVKQFPSLFGSRKANMISAILIHVGLGLFLFFSLAMISWILGLIVGILIPTILFFVWTKGLKPGQLGIITFGGTDVPDTIGAGSWWIPSIKLFGNDFLFNVIIIDGKERTTKCPNVVAVTKSVASAPGSHEPGLQVMVLEFKDVDIQWAPRGRGFLKVEPADVEKGLAGYASGKIRAKTKQSTSDEVLGAEEAFEDALLGKTTGKSSDILAMEDRWDITIFRINIGSIDLTKEMREAIEEPEIQRQEHLAEDIEMKHVEHVITRMASVYHADGDGLPLGQALAEAAQFYQNQVGKATGINFKGSTGDMSNAAAIFAAAVMPNVEKKLKEATGKSKEKEGDNKKKPLKKAA